MTDHTSTLPVYLAIIVLTAAYILLRHTKKVSLWKAVSDELPHQLSGALLYYNEQPLMIDVPFKLFGRPDQIWQRSDGTLVVTDTKKRKVLRHYKSDQIQLTGYAFLLKHHSATKGRKIAPYGFLRIPTESGAQFLKVPLLTEGEYRDLYKRHHALVHSTRRPSGAHSPLICRECGHKRQCTLALVRPS
ncbi:unnamed protein product [Ectocarpus sp. 13 AM-2016]